MSGYFILSSLQKIENTAQMQKSDLSGYIRSLTWISSTNNFHLSLLTHRGENNYIFERFPTSFQTEAKMENTSSRWKRSVINCNLTYVLFKDIPRNC